MLYMCIRVGWVEVCLKGMNVFERRERETTPLYDICYIQFISS